MPRWIPNRVLGQPEEYLYLMVARSENPKRAFRRGLTRLLNHLLRRTALLALLGASFAALVVVGVGASSTMGQTAMVVIGTLISLALLPDEPHRLWNVTAQAMAETIPNEQLAKAGRELAGALAIQGGNLVSIETMQQMWSNNFDELLLAASDPAKVVQNLDYRITATPADHGWLHFDSDIYFEGFIPECEEVHVSFCSDLRALESEFSSANRSCLLRELVLRKPGETLSSWLRRVKGSSAMVSADGRPLQETRNEHKLIDGNDSAVFRFVYEAGPISTGFSGVRITTGFDNPDTGDFPVKFSNYFCVGSTKISFEFRDQQIQMGCNEFLSSSSRFIDVQYISNPYSVKALISTSDNRVLPPGSGVIFTWSAKPSGLLQSCLLVLDALPEGTPQPTAPTLPKYRRPSSGSDEALVEVTGITVLDAYAKLGILEGRSILVRSGVLDKLLIANSLLPDRFELVVLDGWRSSNVQQKLIEHYEAEAVENHYVASLTEESMRAPHLTGGAVDVTLTWNGIPLALGTDFDSFETAAHVNAFEGTDSLIRRLRRMLYSAMSQAGFIPYPLEWWHWSFGDDVWASTTGADLVPYECIEKSDK